MPNLSVKDVPEHWAESLRQRAARNHRSLQGELMAILECAVRDDRHSVAAGVGADASVHTAGDAVIGYGAGGHPIVRRGWKSVGQISAELGAKYPQPITDLPLGVDIIREDRDSR